MITSKNERRRGRLPVLAMMFALLGLSITAPPRTHTWTGQTQQAAAECQPGIGGRLFSYASELELQILPADAGFTIELHLMSPGPQRLIATNRDPGAIVKLGGFPAGTDLIFGIFVRETQKTFLMGGGSANPDGLPHAEVACFAEGRANIGFEDQVGGGDRDYNDLLCTVKQIGPGITGVVRSGKKLFLYGINFDNEAIILLNDEPQKTRYDEANPITVLIGKKAGNWVQPGDTIRVRSRSGVLSPGFTYTPAP